MTISTHRNGRLVIVIYPAEAMNVAAANALLKSLEEPGPNTVFILVTRSIDGLLPTLVSRCRQFVLTMPTAGQAMQWLKAHAIPTPEQFLVEHGGAPLAALAAAQSENHGDQIEFLRYLQHPEWDGALKIADKLSKTPMTLVVSWMQRWLYDVFSYKLSGKIRYYPHYQKEINGVASVMGLPALLSQLDRSSQRRAVAEHPLNAKLVIEEMLLEYVSSIKQL